jgi:hypothetical protein
MASLLSDADKVRWTQDLETVFNTFKQNIVVVKEPKIVLADVAKPRIFGYNKDSDTSNISYIPVSGVFPAIVNFEKNQIADRFHENGNLIGLGRVIIKVQKDASDFISVGKTLGIEIDTQSFDLVSFKSTRGFLPSLYYIYELGKQN